MLVGYARARGCEDNLAVQRADLNRAGCTRIFTDLATGGPGERPGLTAALDSLRPGDVLVVRRLDRLGRDPAQLLQIARSLEAKGAGLEILREAIDTAGDGCRLLVHLLAALADFDRRSARRLPRLRPATVTSAL